MLNMSTVEFKNATPVGLRVISSKPAISVVGLGYVGAVSCACLSHLGHRIVGVDIDQRKISDIAAGRSPIHEKDLGNLLSEGVDANLITATDDLAFAVRETDVTFISVGTPTSKDGGCDYRYIEAAARSMAVGLAQKTDFHVFAMRCSIPPGTTMKIMKPILESMSGKVLGQDFGVAFTPEFLREGVAVEDFFAPPKTVIGATCDRTSNIIRQIYAPVDDHPLITSIECAELVKYVDNVWHAAKVCFGNEVGRLSKSLGVDGHEVMDVFCQDTKLNLSPYYLKPGFAYGGSCLPKEVRAVAHIAKAMGVDVPLIDSLGVSNQAQIQSALDMVRQTGAKRVGVLGVAFKPGTDDLRESPVLEIIAALAADGIDVLVHDTAITKDTPLDGQLSYVKYGSAGLANLASTLPAMLCENVSEVTDHADALIVTHANDTYRTAVKQAGDTPVIDVCRLVKERGQHANIDGIGW